MEAEQVPSAQLASPVSRSDAHDASRLGWAFVLAIVIQALIDAFWLDRKVSQLAPLGVLLASTLSVIAVAQAVAGAGVNWLRRHARGRWVFGLGVAAGCSPLAVAVAWSAMSGERASELRGIIFLKLALTLLLVVAALIGVWLFRWVGEPRQSMRSLIVVAVVMFTGCVVSAYCDRHVLVGLYPALHYLLVACGVYGASLGGYALSGLWRPSFRWFVPGVAILVVSGLVVTAWTWRSQAALRLATYSQGLYPKARRAVQLGTRLTRQVRPAAASRWRAEDFKFQPSAGEQMERIRSSARNVVFILTDAFRADHVERRVDKRPLMPFVAEWEKSPHVVRFKNAYSPSDRTARSMGPLFLSYPTGVVDAVAETGWPLTTWLGRLRERGFRTFANGNCHYLQRRHPQIKIEWCMGSERFANPKDKRPELLVGGIREFIAAVPPGDRFAIYTHWMDSHVKGVAGIEKRYRKAVQTIDDRLKDLVGALKEAGHYDDTLIVWTADHGYALGERGQYRGKHGVLEHMTHVPLMMHVPGLGQAEATIEATVSGLGVGPSILDVVAPDYAGLVGAASLLPLVTSKTASNRDDSFVVTSSGEQHAVHHGRFKLIVNDEDGTVGLFDVKADPKESSPLGQDGVIARLQGFKDEELERQRALTNALRLELDPNTRHALAR